MKMIIDVLRSILIRVICFGKIKCLGIQKFGRGTNIRVTKGKMLFGERVTTRNNVSFSAASGFLRIGQKTFFNNNCTISCRNEILIGDNCSFGPNVVVVDHDHVINHNGFEQDKYKVGSVFIGNGCWFGANVIVLKDSNIGSNCVIAAGTIVKGCIPDNSLVASNNREMEFHQLHD